MDIKNFVLSYYQNATENFHITRITQPREALHLHSHHYYQVYYVVNGTLLHHVEGSAARLTGGDVFILPPDLPHYIETPTDDADFYSMSFTSDFTKDSNKLILDFLYYLQSENQTIQPKISLNYDDSVFIESLLKRIHGEFSGELPGKNELLKELVSVILSILARVYFEKTAQRLGAEENRQRVMHCIGYVKNHFDEELTLSEMVRLSAMSKTSFCAIFTAITGTSFKDYLNRCRIQRAAELLREGERVSAVCIRCGYSDLSTFYRNFKKHKGVSPHTYREETKPAE